MNTTCPHCQSSARIAEEHVGKQARCKKCGNQFRVSTDPFEMSSGQAAPPALNYPVSTPVRPVPAGGAVAPDRLANNPGREEPFGAALPVSAMSGTSQALPIPQTSERKHPDPACAAIASLLLPGLGQFAQGRLDNANLYFFGWIGTVGGLCFFGVLLQCASGGAALGSLGVAFLGAVGVSILLQIFSAIDAAKH